jgi:hypothetical protein
MKFKDVDLVALVIGLLGLLLEFGWVFLLSSEQGGTPIPGTSPNQFLGLVMLVIAVAIWWVWRKR